MLSASRERPKRVVCKSIYRRISAPTEAVITNSNSPNSTNWNERQSKDGEFMEPDTDTKHESKRNTSGNKQETFIQDKNRRGCKSKENQFDETENIDVVPSSVVPQENAENTPRNQTTFAESKCSSSSIDDNDKYSKKSEEDNINNTLGQRKKCPYCSFIYACPKKLLPHVKDSHPSQIVFKEGVRYFKCMFCSTCSTRARNIVSHMHAIHSMNFSPDVLIQTGKFACSEDGCSQSFQRRKLLKGHLLKDHGLDAKKYKQQSKDRRYNMEKLRERAIRLENGQLTVWGERSTVMKHKAASLQTKNHKSSRLKDCHEECWLTARNGDGFSCAYCNKVFLHHSLCVVHEVRHEITDKQHSEVVKCEECEEEFTTHLKLSRHKQLNHCNCKFNSEKNIIDQCDNCSKSLGSPQGHSGSDHKKSPKFICSDCGKTYQRKYSLSMHQKSHHSRGPRPLRGTKPARYECKICGVKLTTYSGMKTHTNKHKGVRPYGCNYCERRFTSMNHWQAHERIHTGIKIYSCTICHKSFTNQGTLYNHLYRYAVHGPLPKPHLNGKYLPNNLPVIDQPVSTRVSMQPSCKNISYKLHNSNTSSGIVNPNMVEALGHKLNPVASESSDDASLIVSASIVESISGKAAQQKETYAQSQIIEDTIISKTCPFSQCSQVINGENVELTIKSSDTEMVTPQSVIDFISQPKEESLVHSEDLTNVALNENIQIEQCLPAIVINNTKEEEKANNVQGAVEDLPSCVQKEFPEQNHKGNDISENSELMICSQSYPDGSLHSDIVCENLEGMHSIVAQSDTPVVPENKLPDTVEQQLTFTEAINRLNGEQDIRIITVENGIHHPAEDVGTEHGQQLALIILPPEGQQVQGDIGLNENVTQSIYTIHIDLEQGKNVNLVLQPDMVNGTVE